MLNMSTAKILLAQITNSPIQAVEQITNTNDVFKVVTEQDGNFYVKFHTSAWYKDAEDTNIVVQREAAVYELLKRRGFPLAYRTWTDCTRQVVNRSVLISSELGGIPLPEALKEAPGECDQIIIALAGFLKRLHAVEFPRAGYIEFSGEQDLSFSLNPLENPWFDSHACQKPENFRVFALDVLKSKEKFIPANVFAGLKERFERIPEILGAEYQPPRFVINNYHPFHLHVARELSGWQVIGLYDFEAVSAGNPLFDLIGNELQITPVTGNLSWRPVFYKAYGGYPAFEAYKTILLCFLLLGLRAEPGAAIPDPEWLIQKLPSLINASDYDTLNWYPER